MGIYDRNYYQADDLRGYRRAGGPRMMVTQLVIITVAIALIDLFTPPMVGQQSHWLSSFLALKPNLYRHPWEVWNLLSYGFAHASIDVNIWHVAINMFVLWMFGRMVELRLGRREFLCFYLAAIVGAGLAWLAIVNVWALGAGRALPVGAAGMVGASGGVTAVFILYVLYYPRQTVYFWGLFAMPAWVVGVIVIGLDLLNAVRGTETHVAWQAHLGGAAFAYFYARFGWRFTRGLSARGPWRWPRSWPRRGSRLRIHRPDTDEVTLDREADRILEKVHREGEQSLSGRERRILEQYSRRMREKRQP